MTLGHLVRHHREARGWTQGELSKRMGNIVGQNTISAIELGRSKMPTQATLHALANALGIPEEELLKVSGYMPERANDPPALPPEILALHQRVQESAPERRDLLLEVLALVNPLLERIAQTPEKTPELPPELLAIHRDLEQLPPEQRVPKLQKLTQMYQLLSD